MLLSRYQEGLFTAVGDVRAVNIMTIARAVMPLLFIGVPLLVGASERAAIACWVLWWVALAAVMYLPARARRSAARGGRASGATTAAWARTEPRCQGSTRSSRCTTVSASWRSRLFAGDAAVGVLSVAIAARELVLLAAQSGFASSSFHAIGVAERTDTPALTLRAMRHVVLLATVGSAAVILATLVGLAPLVGPGFEEVPGLIALLAPSTVALGCLYQIFQFFEVRGREPHR